jgi:subtilisin-like proprotein convertase family protein
MRFVLNDWKTGLGAVILTLGLLSPLGLAQPVLDASGMDDQAPTALLHAEKLRAVFDAVETPPLDLARIAVEDLERESQGLPPRFAIPNQVHITPDTAGTWEQLDDHLMIWRLLIRAPGALSINLGFTRYHMPAGGRLMVYASDLSHIVRPFTERDNAEHGELWTPVVISDEIVVEVTLPVEAMERLELELTSINHGYRGFGESFGSRSGSCNVDVVCPEGDGWRDEIASVGVISTGGYTFCTGFMVNNTAQDLTPYFMTANHCGINSGNAASLVVYWNYENSWCRPVNSGASGGPGDGQLNQFNTGSFFRASYSSSDFTLVELDSDPDPSFQVAFAGWDNTSADATSAVAIHHPNTDEKRISFEYDPTSTTSYLGTTVPGDGTHVRITDWDLGTTEPGSSGSPLFDQNHHVVGQLHGGYAACGNNDSDWYGRFSRSWTGGGSNSTRLSNWLDPGGTGATFVDTIPGGGMIVNPGGEVLHLGVVGGPFTNPLTTYTLTNPTGTPLDYDVSLDPLGTAPVLINGGSSPITGTLAGGGGSTTIDVTLDPSVNSLATGIYSTDVLFTDTTHGITHTRTHTVEVGTTNFTTVPDYGLEAGGPVGGPFTATVTYTLTSTRPTPVDVQIAASDNWISLDGGTAPVVVTLNGTGDSANVVVGFSTQADSLPAGIVSGTVTFSNLSGGGGDTSRPVTLDVGRFSYTANDTPIAINDNSTIQSFIDVPDAFCIGDVDVMVDITHTYIGDLIVEVTSPEGTTVRLHNRGGGSADNIVTTYDDSTNPPAGPGLLADFIGEVPTGVWTMTISDNAGADTGSLNSWTLKVAAGGPGCGPVAEDVSVNVPHTVVSSIQLQATSTVGQPMQYIITSLPTNGTLVDPQGSIISATPYTLLNQGDIVDYQPDPGFVGPDGFHYKANDGYDSNIATVSVTVGFPETILDFPLDTDPGWSTTGSWAFGQPLGWGSHGKDPTGGYTGSNVYGYNLFGDYTDNMPERYLTTTALDLTDVVSARLEFRRWLGVEDSQYDHAAVQVSNDASNWSTIWQHAGRSVSDTAWALQTYDISAVADDQPTVYVRWIMGTTDGSITYPGWNIDDVRIIGVRRPGGSQLDGDIDSDGDVDLNDFATFARCFSGQAVTVPPPSCSPSEFILSDLQGDGDVDLNDFSNFANNFTG